MLRAVRDAREDYKRFHNFLMTHGCKVDYREFRGAGLDQIRTAPAALFGGIEPEDVPRSPLAQAPDSQELRPVA